ncbi:ABC transporter transmembrane domain-containing protein [Micromonospora sp. URMC 103]|uniref:ABC transporter transmembrane domain-containing protein n=1 Tax=Micromonospora sp. URMC 103 TaxID=3423406 RepID=UPI003F19F22B
MPPSIAHALPRLRLLLSFVAPHRATLLLGLVLGLAANAAGLATPMVTKWVLDSLGAGASMTRPIGVLLALVLVGAAITLWQWRLLGALAEHIVLDARTAIVGRYLRARLGELQRRPTGELVTRVTSDPALLHQASSSIVGLVNSAIALVGTLVLMGLLDLFLLGCTIAAVVVVAAVMGALLPAIGKATTAAQESVGRLGGTLEGALRAIRTVKASRAEARLANGSWPTRGTSRRTAYGRRGSAPPSGRSRGRGSSSPSSPSSASARGEPSGICWRSPASSPSCSTPSSSWARSPS